MNGAGAGGQGGWGDMVALPGREHAPADDVELAAGFQFWRERGPLEGPAALEEFLRRRPDSAWAPSLHNRLASYYDELGRQSLAIQHWEAAWRMTLDDPDPAAQAVADQALAHWLERVSVLGWSEVLDPVVPLVQDRIMGRGWLQQMFARGLENYRLLSLAPAGYQTCGSVALLQLAARQGRGRKLEGILRVRPPGTGFSLAQLRDLAEPFGLHLTPIKLNPTAPIPVPCVAHLTIDHYVAVLEERDGFYLTADPALGRRRWLRAEVLAAESSGYALVPAKQASRFGQALTEEEARAIRGRGYGNQINDGLNTPCPPGEHGDGGANAGAGQGGNCGSCTAAQRGAGKGADLGMPVWKVDEPFINLWVQDTPLACPRSDGKSLNFSLYHKQRHEAEAGSDWASHLFKVGAGWNCNRLSYIDANQTSGYLNLYVSGGGMRPYYAYGYTSWTDYDTGAILQATYVGYEVDTVEVHWPDGAVNTYADGFTATELPDQKCLLLTEQRDAAGRLTTYTYQQVGGVQHLLSVTDGRGATLTFQYGDGGSAPLDYLRLVQDSYGRQATLIYDATGHLTGIQDVAGITSNFSYDSYDWITSMTTPYGMTSFDLDGVATVFMAGVFNRWCRVHEPDGSSIHLFAYRDSPPTSAPLAIPDVWPAADIPSLPWSPLFDGQQWMSGRNSFHWAPRQYAQLSADFLASFDFSKLNADDAALARMRHWLIRWLDESLGNTLSMERAPTPDGVTAGQTTWLDYPGRYADDGNGGNAYIPVFEGDSKLPATIGRVMPDGSSWGIHLVRNSAANITQLTEAWHDGTAVQTRAWTVTYDANAIDPVRLDGPGSTWLASFTYDPAHPHRPATRVNNLGTTTLGYNTSHLLISVLHPNGRTTTLQRDANGFVQQLTDTANNTTLRNWQFTWSKGLPSTLTDPRNLTRTFTWDDLNRVTRIDYDADATWEEFQYLDGATPILDLSAHRDRRGLWTTYTYTPLRQVATLTDPLGHVTAYTYCDCGAPDSVTRGYGTPEAETTQYAYDNVGNLHRPHLPGPDQPHPRLRPPWPPPQPDRLPRRHHRHPR